MRAVAVIPARYRSTRFPGKPLAPIAGRSMLQRVWEGTRTAKSLRAVIVATDDERIAEVCRGFGAEVALTDPNHPTGTDRIAEVARGVLAGVAALLLACVLAAPAADAAPTSPISGVVEGGNNSGAGGN